MSALNLPRLVCMIQGAKLKIRDQGFPGREYACLLHPSTVDDMCKADARSTWYAQHRENRIAKRTGRPARAVERQFTASTEQMLGVRLIVDDGTR